MSKLLSRGRGLRVWAAMAACLAAAGCADFLGPLGALEYPDGVPYFDEPMFTPIWNELRACSKLDRKLSSIEFYYVPRVTLPPVDPGIRTLGMYFPESDRIFVVESAKSDHDVVRHEMMHALLHNTPGHPPKYFSADGVCGVV